MQNSALWSSASGTSSRLHQSARHSEPTQQSPSMPCCVNRCENERKRRRSLEEELSKLRLLEEDLQIAVLPGLQDWLNRLTEQTTELQIRHQQVKL